MNKITLFAEPSLRSYLQDLTTSLRSTINQLDEKELASPNIETIVGRLVTKYVLTIPVILGDKTEYKSEQVNVPVNNLGRQVNTKGMKFTFFVPFKGSAELFLYRTMEFDYNNQTAGINGQELQFDYVISADEDATKVKLQHDNIMFKVKLYLERVEKEVAPYNNGVANVINSAVSARRAEIEKINKMGNSLGVKKRE